MISIIIWEQCWRPLFHRVFLLFVFRRHAPRELSAHRIWHSGRCPAPRRGVRHTYDGTRNDWPDIWWTSPWSSSADSALWDRQTEKSGCEIRIIQVTRHAVTSAVMQKHVPRRFLLDPRAWEEKGGEQAMVPSKARMLMIDVCSWLNTSTSWGEK